MTRRVLCGLYLIRPGLPGMVGKVGYLRAFEYASFMTIAIHLMTLTHLTRI